MLKADWRRFLDDCFVFWKTSRQDLSLFFDLLNNLHQDIKFTMETSEKSILFLDILIIKEHTEIITDIYFKETDTKQYLNYFSCHPKHTKNSIPYNVSRRVCTIVSGSELRMKRLQELKNSLIARKYPMSLIESGINKALNIPRDRLMQVKTHSKDNTIPYVSTFNPNNAEMFGIFTNNLHILHSDNKLKDALNGTKLIKSKRQPTNLKKLLTREKFTENSTAQRKVTKCGRPNCSLCLDMPNGSSYNFNGKVFSSECRHDL